MAQYQRRILLFLVSFSCFMHFSNGYQFIVGGRNGWVLNPSENYNHWSGRMRFQVNDTLLFRYKSGSDSVLVVNKNDYDNCNTGNPILKLEDGNSIFKFDRSGPFYFISGNKANCDQGQKLIVVVLAVRNRPAPPPPNAPSPAGGTPSPANPPSPAGEAPGPATHGSGPSPAAGAPGPATHGSGPSPASGAPGPATHASGPSPAGEAPGPATHGSGPSPASGAPGPATDGSGLSPASGAPGPATDGSGLSPANVSPTTPGSPNSSTPGNGGTPADVNSPGGSPPRSLAAPPCSPSILLVSLVLSVGLGGFIVSH